jgi:hypothetical protein
MRTNCASTNRRSAGAISSQLLVQENGQCRDPGAYVAALIRHAVASGATLRQARATGFRIENRGFARSSPTREKSWRTRP